MVKTRIVRQGTATSVLKNFDGNWESWFISRNKKLKSSVVHSTEWYSGAQYCINVNHG